MDFTPNFNDTQIDQASLLEIPETFEQHIAELVKQPEIVPHAQIITMLVERIIPLDFHELANLPDDEKLKNNHLQIITVEQVLKLAKENKWGLCRNHEFIYLYNGAFWKPLNMEELTVFLGEAAQKMGVDPFKAKDYRFRESLFKQFLALSNLPKPNRPKDKVLVNLKNGTFEITPFGTKLKPFNPADFLTYQLPFGYDPEAKAPIFDNFLNEVLPDRESQNVLAEYLGSVFLKSGTIKEEKVLFLYGTGANGKSVVFEVMKAMLGPENTSNCSLEDLTNGNGYHRATIANALLNYGSEISGKMSSALFKQMASKEPISARLPYGKPMTLEDYASLMFNVNELPWDVEQTDGFFRRFLIIHFAVTIPEEKQDKELHNKIIDTELSGVFNWVLQGLSRLLEQRRFSNCQAANEAREQYKIQSDSVKLYLQENNYVSSPTNHKHLKWLYEDYREFCGEDGFQPVSKAKFRKRLMSTGIVIEKRNVGNVVFIEEAARSWE